MISPLCNWHINEDFPFFNRKSRWWFHSYFLFSPRNLGKMKPIWQAYFSNGSLNHQLVKLTQTMTWVFPLPSNSINDYFIFRLGDSYKPSFDIITWERGQSKLWHNFLDIYILFCALHDFELPALLIKKVPMNPVRIFFDKPKQPHQQKGVLPWNSAKVAKEKNTITWIAGAKWRELRTRSGFGVYIYLKSRNHTLPETTSNIAPDKWMFGRWISFWVSASFQGANLLLVSGRLDENSGNDLDEFFPRFLSSWLVNLPPQVPPRKKGLIRPY